jgi:hypothetical protein
LPVYKDSAITAKSGINYVRNIVEKNGSLFHKIEQENDLGIDAIIEFIENGKPTNRSIAVQIKSGVSYLNDKKTVCYIPVDDHYDYWMNYPLPVYGIVYNPDSETGNWINIKNYLKSNKNSFRVNINKNLVNIFDHKNYVEIFSKILKKQTPMIDLKFAIKLFMSDDYEESDLGLYTIFNNYRNEEIVWKEMISFLNSEQGYKISNRLISNLAHIPWHGDIFHYGEKIRPDIKEYAKIELSKISIDTVVKLIELIDDNGISRGTIGQSIEAILENIISDIKLNNHIRFYAAGLYAFYRGTDAIVFLKKYYNVDGIDFILQNLYEFGHIDFYG